MLTFCIVIGLVLLILALVFWGIVWDNCFSRVWYVVIAAVLVGYVLSAVLTYRCDISETSGVVTKTETIAGRNKADPDYLVFVQLDGSNEVAVLKVPAHVYGVTFPGDTVPVYARSETLWWATEVTYYHP